MANIVEMPKLGFDMAEGTLVSWIAEEGQDITKGDVLADIETDKATVQVESSFTGIVHKHLVEENKTIPIGTPIAVIADKGEDVDLEALLKQASKPDKPSSPPPETASAEKQPAPQLQNTGTDDEFIKASPLAKKIAADAGIKLSSISGTGPEGRIVKRDVEKHLSDSPAPTAKTQSVKTETAIRQGEDQQIPISKLRAAIGRRMVTSHTTIPDFTITYSYDVEALITMRQQMNADRADEEQLSVNDFIVKAVALALRDYPNLNASISEEKIIRHGNINIGNAVAVESGLLTIVVNNADQKSLDQIGHEISTMAGRVRAGKVNPDDIEGSTFTISNLGMFNVHDFTAIINPPEAAILAVASAQETPIIENGNVLIGWRMKATIAADHRITDGAEAAQFMRHLSTFLEQPWRLI